MIKLEDFKNTLDLKKYEDIYFKKVSTYNKKEFEEKFIKKYELK